MYNANVVYSMIILLFSFGLTMEHFYSTVLILSALSQQAVANRCHYYISIGNPFSVVSWGQSAGFVNLPFHCLTNN